MLLSSRPVWSAKCSPLWGLGLPWPPGVRNRVSRGCRYWNPLSPEPPGLLWSSQHPDWLSPRHQQCSVTSAGRWKEGAAMQGERACSSSSADVQSSCPPSQCLQAGMKGMCGSNWGGKVGRCCSPPQAAWGEAVVLSLEDGEGVPRTVHPGFVCDGAEVGWSAGC